MQKITPFLWFDTEAEEAMNYYTSIFKNSKKGEVVRSPEIAPGAPGNVLVCSFEVEGMAFTALNGGPEFKFTEAVSFYVNCKDQEEVDYYWSKLTADGGEESMCGWLRDKYGLSWQIIPAALTTLLGDPDREKANRAMQAMLQMQKIDVAKIEAAAKG